MPDTYRVHMATHVRQHYKSSASVRCDILNMINSELRDKTAGENCLTVSDGNANRPNNDVDCDTKL